MEFGEAVGDNDDDDVELNSCVLGVALRFLCDLFYLVFFAFCVVDIIIFIEGEIGK